MLPDLLYIEAQSSSVCLRMVSSCVCFSLSLTLLDTDVDCSKNSFPSQSAFVAYAFIIGHLQFSDLVTTRPPQVQGHLH